jgi:hypothetical protein
VSPECQDSQGTPWPQQSLVTSTHVLWQWHPVLVLPGMLGVQWAPVAHLASGWRLHGLVGSQEEAVVAGAAASPLLRMGSFQREGHNAGLEAG